MPPRSRRTLPAQALVSNKPDVVRLLLSEQHRHKLDSINAIDSQGRTALHIASFKAEPEIVQLLLESGVCASARAASRPPAPPPCPPRAPLPLEMLSLKARASLANGTDAPSLPHPRTRDRSNRAGRSFDR
jgi:ankyrin repeat protein